MQEDSRHSPRYHYKPDNVQHVHTLFEPQSLETVAEQNVCVPHEDGGGGNVTWQGPEEQIETDQHEETTEEEVESVRTAVRCRVGGGGYELYRYTGGQEDNVYPEESGKEGHTGTLYPDCRVARP